MQHHEGGIVQKIMIKDGDHVSAGQPLIMLDDTQVRAEFDVLNDQYFELKAERARLESELQQKSSIDFPDELARNISIGNARSVLSGQVQQFDLRRAAQVGQRRIISEKIAQLESQISGAEAQERSDEIQRSSILKEAKALESLVDRGVVARPRLLQLQRSAAAFDGQVGELTGSIARSRQAISEQRQLEVQLDRDRLAQIANDLHTSEVKISEVGPRLASTAERLKRLELRAPYAGRIVSLTVFSTGAVIAPGEKVLDIVPDEETLVVEAQVGVEDIADIHTDAPAEIRLVAYKQRTTPIMHGQISRISADRLTDKRNGLPFYSVEINLNKDELNSMPGIKLYPGMPTSVMIPTIERSAFDYLTSPLVSAFDKSFRQK